MNYITELRHCIDNLNTCSRLCSKLLLRFESGRELHSYQYMKYSTKLLKNKIEEIRNEDAKSIKTEKTSKHYNEIMNHLNSKECLRATTPLIPSRFLSRRVKSPESLYLIDSDVAEEIFDLVKSDLLSEDSHVIEVNPGLGLITKKLLSAKIPKLRLFETEQHFVPHLKNMISQSDNRNVDILHLNFNHVWSMAYQDRMDNGKRVENIMSGIACKPWESQPVVKILGALPNYKFIKYFIFSTIFQNGISLYGRPEMYVILTPPAYVKLTCSGEAGYLLYRSLSVLFQLIFEAEILKKIPYTAFVPWISKYVPQKKSKLMKVHKIDPEFLYLVKIKARHNFYTEIVPPAMLKPVWYYVRQHMVRRTGKVIPQMERWVPGCGPRLVAKGLTIFHEFGDLTPQQILDVFLEFSSWPEFSTCPFLHSMENSLIKMEEPGNDDDFEDEDDDSSHGKNKAS